MIKAIGIVIFRQSEMYDDTLYIDVCSGFSIHESFGMSVKNV